MKKLLISSLVVLGGCASMYKPEVWSGSWNDKPGLHTLRLYTGSFGESLYEKNFEEKATDVCKGKYEVMAKTKTPSTLPSNLYDDGHFTWVIKCTP